jgi:protein-S-isoprenylcysteine O-methyltransferase Ste14
MSRSLRRLALPAGLLELAGMLEAGEIVRQRRRGAGRSLVTSGADLDPASVRLLALTWWPAGVAALAAAVGLPQAGVTERWTRPCLLAGVAATGAGVALRQWAIATLGEYFVGHVVIQPGQIVVSSGPYRWLRHPAYTGQWLEMIGVGLSTGNVVSAATCVLVPLVGITRRISGEERELAASLPGYGDYIQGKPRLIPFLW